MIINSRKDLLKGLFTAALQAVDPYRLTKQYTDEIRSLYRREDCSRIIVVSLGKAALNMARAVEENLGDYIESGIIITKYAHGASPGIVRKMDVFEAGHPVPDENGMEATEKIIKLLSGADERNLIVFLISGGGSSLLVSPLEGISLAEKREVTGMLLKAGADIGELNAVRKHISRVKGGRLMRYAGASRAVSLLLSDVIGDRLDVIASGPTSPDSTNFADALMVLEKYGLVDVVPAAVLDALQSGRKGMIPETLKVGDEIFDKVENIIIGSNKKALQAIVNKAGSMELAVKVISDEIQGEARDMGNWLAKKALKIADSKAKDDKSLCLISGGETTVTVKGGGKGGRNMEMALSFAMEIEGAEGVTLLSAGTDGTDGPTDSAGAFADGKTVQKARDIGLNPIEYLENNDSYHFFEKVDGLYITGPTGTNVMDIQIILIE